MLRLVMIVFLLLIFVGQLNAETIHIIEDLPIGTSIYTFSTSRCSSSFRFVDHQKNFNDYFLIDLFTGRVTTKKLLDREEFCSRRMCSCSQCEISLEILCLHQGEIFFNDLKIILDDRNDHSPTFSKTFLHVDVFENVPIGYFIPIDVAIDLDFGENSIENYRLIEENSTNRILNAFQLEYSKKNELLALRLLKSLDREICSNLQYKIEASDGGKPYPRTGRMTVQLNIVDVNDMSPIFDHSDLHFNLSESTAIGSLIGRVHATDRDIGPNGLINYTIISVEPSSSKNFFFLSTNSGEIFLDVPLDFEKEKFFRIQIKAQDNGAQQGSTPAFVNVYLHVHDENDNSPLIIPMFNDDPSSGVEYLFNSNVIRIRENLPDGIFLGHISISDLDQGENGRLSCQLNSSETIFMKSLVKNESFLLFTQRKFDREERSNYSIRFFVHDHGEPQRSTIFDFTLIITDENDHRPEFDRKFYLLNISEGTPVNSTLVRFNAVDRDEIATNNSRISFRLAEFSSKFSVDSTSGDLILISSLDREERENYEFDVVAFDHGFPFSLSSTIRCRVNIVDMNDHPPQFNQTFFQFDLPETWPIDKPIGQIFAEHFDEEFHRIRFRLDSQLELPFVLTENGTLILTKTLDFERNSSYRFDVIAEDNGGLTSRVPVVVSIRNRNDFCPDLLNYSSVLFFNTDEKENLFDFELFDGDNDTCRMELMNFRESFQLFEIERNRFRLIANENLSREYYRLEFQLEDLIDEDENRSCRRTIEYLLTTGSNETNRTLAMELAREYFFALKSIERRSSAFHWTLFNLILIFVLFLFALLVSLLAIKLICYRTKRSNQLYRYQGQTETQLPLLDDEQQKQMLKENFVRYSSPCAMRDSGYDTTSSSNNLDQWMSVSYSSTADRSTSIYLSRHLKTFSMN